MGIRLTHQAPRCCGFALFSLGHWLTPCRSNFSLAFGPSMYSAFMCRLYAPTKLRFRKDRDRLEHKRFRVECVTLGVLVIYALITLLMYCANKKAAEAAKSAADTAAAGLELAQRPWLSVSRIEIERVDTSDPSHPGFTLGYDVHNSGQGVATLYGVYAQLWLDLGPDPDG